MTKKPDGGSVQSTPGAGFRVAASSGIAVPARMQILEFLRVTNQPCSLEKICSHFGLQQPEGIRALSGRLERMKKNGYVLVDRKTRYGLPEKMDIVAGRVIGHARGFGFVIPDMGGEDLYLHHNQMRKVLHGDRVLAKTRAIDSRGRKEGVVVEVLVDKHREIVGHFHVESAIGFVEPDDVRFARDISIPKNKFNGAKSGDIVVVRISKHPVEHQHAVGEVIDVLGQDLAPGMETEIALRKHDIPHRWPVEVEQQLKSMGDLLHNVRPHKNRIDIRELPLVTIDGVDARDFDDAVYCEKAGSGWRLIVAIADVSHYVRPDSALDREAYNRGNSVYFPNRVVPMLPESLSNGICSLKPDEDRYCMVCDMQVNKPGEVKDFRFYPGLMRSKARLTYELVNAIVSEKDKNQRDSWRSIAGHLDHLYELSLCFRQRREIRGAVEFEFPEPYIQFDDQKRIRRISARQRNEAHRLIEECMLAANVCAAEFLRTHKGYDAIYRNHAGPDADALVDLRKFLSGLGLNLGGGNNPQARDYSKLVASVSSRTDIAGVVQSVLLRSLNQAVYSAEQLGHFALAYPVYSHFTSPIRRYCDLVVHRQVRQILDGGESREFAPSGIGTGQIGEHCSFTERRAEDAVRDVIAWLKAEFMQQKVGEEFNGLISGVREFGIFVQLSEIFVEGLVHVTALGNDYYHFDPARFQLQGERSNQRFRLGDKVRVRVVRVDMDEAKIDFELVSEAAVADKAKNTGGELSDTCSGKKSENYKNKTTKKPGRDAKSGKSTVKSKIRKGMKKKNLQGKSPGW